MAKQTVFGHYLPHERVQEKGEIVNPHTGEVIVPPSMTKQEFVKECDINNILKQYSQTGMLRHVSANASAGAYQDLPDGLDFQQALHIVEEGRAAFMSLPSKVRSRFGNQPEQFLAFLADPANRDEAVKLGLVELPPVVAPIAVSIATSPGEESDQEKTAMPAKA